MPEIAEVETFRRQLSPLLSGEVIQSFSCSHPRSIRRHENVDDFIQHVVGVEIDEVLRHGKYLALRLANGDYLNVHLRMSGRFLTYDQSSYEAGNNPKHSHVIFTTDKNVFVFVDPRTFGELWITRGLTPEMTRGLDSFDSTVAKREKVLLDIRSTNKPLKTVLLDQNILSGIGNIYADEICADARLNPTRKYSTLTQGELNRLNQSCGSVLTQAVLLRGSSLRDESFRDLYGEIGNFQTRHVVHAKKNCARCGNFVEKTKTAGRSTYFCPNCQK